MGWLSWQAKFTPFDAFTIVTTAAILRASFVLPASVWRLLRKSLNRMAGWHKAVCQNGA
jgi:hypothetical protein